MTSSDRLTVDLIRHMLLLNSSTWKSGLVANGLYLATKREKYD